ncbi:hypothetical protein [Leeuwenhoekiella sp. NPDC079379]|uniref:hypothetical protein n=1 Tax=Leeuwenhoekiella sp. NPDC079379 TaxID=3364122 RepID=UPI0037C6E4CE
MKTLKTILFAIMVSLLFTFCAKNKSEKNNEINFTNTELIGKWNQEINDKVSKIKSIQLLNDSIAKIQLINSSGENILMGKWENGFEKKFENSDLVFNSDIKITYYTDKNNTNVLLLKVSEENKKLFMNGYNLKLKKE